jgi:hypothetical protein
MNNEKRVDKLEEQIGVNQKEETLEEMLQAFLRGEYGNIADLFRMITAGVPIDPLKSAYPEEVIKYFQELHAQ